MDAARCRLGKPLYARTHVHEAARGVCPQTYASASDNMAYVLVVVNYLVAKSVFSW